MNIHWNKEKNETFNILSIPIHTVHVDKHKKKTSVCRNKDNPIQLKWVALTWQSLNISNYIKSNTITIYVRHYDII